MSDSLQKTVEEKQEAYDKAVDELDGVEKHIEAEVQDEIKSEKDKGVKLSLADEQKIRERVNALPENVSLLKNANDKVDKAKDALSEAENALSAYQ